MAPLAAVDMGITQEPKGRSFEDNTFLSQFAFRPTNVALLYKMNLSFCQNGLELSDSFSYVFIIIYELELITSLNGAIPMLQIPKEIPGS